MRCAWLLILFLISNCQCEDGSLQCSVNDEFTGYCTVNDDDGSWSEIDVNDVDWNVSYRSGCRLGKPQCNVKTQEIYCDGFQGPTEETCDNIDNDCDGILDEDQTIRWGQEGNNCAEMMRGDCQVADQKCRRGVTFCDPLGNYPSPEVCDGRDNDCDGPIDEDIPDLECWTGPNDIDLNSTICETGHTTCQNGRWSECLDQILPAQEFCDGVDNDCDGLADNFTQLDYTACGVDVGECRQGYYICVNLESVCVEAEFPQNEICDGLDNDCDGEIDEDLYELCSTECGNGIATCSDGEWAECTAEVPVVEICDWVDNDCDGEIDEGCSCNVGQEAECKNDVVNSPVENCGVGRSTCNIFGEWGPCVYIYSEDEVCDGHDNDCDGITDMITEPCGNFQLNGIGNCKLGERTCFYNEWELCDGAVDPAEEVCDGEDNDCDGEINEDLNIYDKVDIFVLYDGSVSMCDEKIAFHEALNAYAGDFLGTDHKLGLGVFPQDFYTPYRIETTPPLTGVVEFQSALEQANCSFAGIEPSYNALKEIISPEDPAGIGWRSDAYPFVIVITDEEGQSSPYDYLTEAEVAETTTNCQIGSCEPGDKVEVFVITKVHWYTLYWDDVVYGEVGRIKEINPPSTTRYIQILREIFQQACIEGVNATN